MIADLASALALTAGDGRPWSPATVLSVDVASARVTVDLDGGPVVLRRVAAPYRAGDTVAVVRDETRSGAGQFVAGIIGPAAPVWRPGTVTAIDTGAARLTVTVDGSSMVLPYVSATYSVSGTVAVLLDTASGMGGLVLGPVGTPPTAPASPATPTTPTTSTTATVGPFPIRPTWSGTWRVDRSAWDRWNTTRYGGRSDLYQGADYGSGTLVGMAVYGDQVAALGLETITSIVLTVTRNGSGGGPVAITVQSSASGTQPAGAPSSTGDTASSSALAVNASGQIALSASVCEDLRTGAKKGLVLVGATYAGVYGTSRADGMVMAVTGTKAI